MKIADRVQQVPPSGIRRFFELAEEKDDIISLGVGEPDFSAPWAARDAAITSLEQGKTSYTANKGRLQLRQAIARHVQDRYNLSYDPDEEILVTAGASEGLDLAFRALVDPGDTVAVAQPCYVSYVPGVTFAGGEVLPVETRQEDDFTLTPDVLDEHDAHEADILVYCYPNNPTGATMTRDEIEAVAEYARTHDLTVFADEIYADLTYQHEHTSIASLPGMAERTVVFNGFSKAYAMTGLRLGYTLAPPAVTAAMNRIHQYTLLSAPTTAQYAAIEALESCDDAVGDMRDEYNRRRNLVLNRFDEMGLECFPASGAFYAFPACPWEDDEEFAEALLEAQDVAVVPGSVFGGAGGGHLRVSYATGYEALKEALDRIEAFIS